jgi:hypothetical protein
LVIEMKEIKTKSWFVRIIQISALLIGIFGFFMVCFSLVIVLVVILKGEISYESFAFFIAMLFGILIGAYFAWTGYSLLRGITKRTIKHLSAVIAFLLYVILETFAVSYGNNYADKLKRFEKDIALLVVHFLPFFIMLIVYTLLNRVLSSLSIRNNILLSHNSKGS